MTLVQFLQKLLCLSKITITELCIIIIIVTIIANVTLW